MSKSEFVCEGGYRRCPKCTCGEKALIVGDDLSSHPGTGRLLSAKQIRTKFGFRPLTDEQKQQNLEDNLSFFCDQVSFE